MKATPVLILAILANRVPAAEPVSSAVVQKVVSERGAYYNRDTDLYAKEKAVADISGWLSGKHGQLSDFDRVSFYTTLAEIETIQHGCDHDPGKAREYMSMALRVLGLVMTRPSPSPGRGRLGLRRER